MKNRGACSLTCAGGLLYTIKIKSACREPDLILSELRGLGPSSPVKNQNSLACLPGQHMKNRNSLTWLTNAGSYFAIKYCTLRSREIRTGISEVSKKASIFVGLFKYLFCNNFKKETDPQPKSPDGSH